MKRTKDASMPEVMTDITLSINSNEKVNAKVTGWFFIAATVSAIIGLMLYDPILNSNEYLLQGALNSNQIILGAIFELILVCTICGTAIMLYPLLKKYNERLGMAYFCFRVLEAIIILLGIVSVLALLTLSHSYVTSSNPDGAIYNAAGIIAKAYHDWTFLLGPKFLLGINTFIYSYVFYKTGLVPKKLSLLGLTGASLVFIVSLLEMFSVVTALSATEIIFAFPVAIYEMILAIWLITRGFDFSNITRSINY